MKGEHEEVKQHHNTAPTTNPLPTTMFSSFHPHHHQHQHQQLQQFQHHQQCQGSEEENSHSSGGGGIPIGSPDERAIVIKKIKTVQPLNSSGSGGGTGGGGDGASIEVVKRPRGRPPGSKNKPKPPIIITRDAECAMRPHVLEIPSGIDIVDSIGRFARQRNIGLCVLSASGSVANVSLRQPNTTPGTTLTFPGRFDILSISATYLPPSANTPSISNGLTISLAGPQGQIFGGSVVGGLVAAGTVFVVASSFTNPCYHRLPLEEDCPTTETAAASGGGAVESHPSPMSSCGMSTYNFHLPSDVIWAPTARQPPPPSQF